MAKPDKEKKGKISFVNMIGLGILLICYAGALWNVFQIKKVTLIDNKKVIRLCHWQLEMGVRDALAEMIKEYEAYPGHEDRKVIQIPITERVYSQWVTTQLMGRTAPDLIQVGFFDVNSALPRYFEPLTEILEKPNPYNKDNDLRNVSWKDTFTDSLQNSYKPELLDYFTVGFSQFSVRLFYNADMLKELTGSGTPPETLDEFFKLCDKVNEFTAERNKAIKEYNDAHPLKWWQYLPFAPTDQKPKFVFSPVASSKYQVNIFKARYFAMFTANKYIKLDLDFDGNVSQQEMLIGALNGKLTMEDPQYKQSREIVRKLATYFPRGFMSVDRMDAGFGFVQGRSLMITSGSWDAKSFIKQIKDQPFGDIILKINDVEVANARAVKERLLELLESGEKKIKLYVDREGSKRTVSLTPGAGKNIWKSIGVAVADFEKKSKDGSTKSVPVIKDINPVSPASDVNLQKRLTFNIVIGDFPKPTKDNPEYGNYVVERVAETMDTGFAFGLTKFSKYPDIALDFLQFCTGRKNNEKLNAVAEWIPAVRGAKPTPFLEAFVPNFKGYWGALDMNLGKRSRSKVEQLFWPYVSGDISYEQYEKEITANLPYEAAFDHDSYCGSISENIPDKEVRRSLCLAKYVFSDTKKEKEDAERKLAGCWDVLVDYNTRKAILDAMMAPSFKEQDKNDFSKKFFSKYNSLQSGSK